MGACARDGERCPPCAKLFTLLKLLGESSPRKVRVTGLLPKKRPAFELSHRQLYRRLLRRVEALEGMASPLNRDLI